VTGALPTLRTPRLVLRPFSAGDAADVRRLAGERDIAATTLTVPHPYPEGAAEEWIVAHAGRVTRGEAAVFAVTLADTGALVGAIGLEIQAEHSRGELGYWVGKPYWGRGYATEAGRAVVRFAFQELGLSRVFACHFKVNAASGRVMEKLGMRREGKFRRHLVKWETPQDLVYYGLLSDDPMPPDPADRE
jgi:RimJ/RimL family protein N-acetyltransferase